MRRSLFSFSLIACALVAWVAIINTQAAAQPQTESVLKRQAASGVSWPAPQTSRETAIRSSASVTPTAQQKIVFVRPKPV